MDSAALMKRMRRAGAVSSTLTEQHLPKSPQKVIEAGQGVDFSDEPATIASQLKAAAVRLHRAGWPVLPAAHPAADRLVSGRCPPDEQTAADWWSDQPYGIACRTGELFDALQVPSWLGARLLPSVEHYATVVEVTRALESVWLFLVTPGAVGIADLPRSVDIRLHTTGGWILLPPTPTLGGASRWVSRPAQLRLPHALTMQWAVVRAVSAARRELAQRRPAPGAHSPAGAGRTDPGGVPSPQVTAGHAGHGNILGGGTRQ